MKVGHGKVFIQHCFVDELEVFRRGNHPISKKKPTKIYWEKYKLTTRKLSSALLFATSRSKTFLALTDVRGKVKKLRARGHCESLASGKYSLLQFLCVDESLGEIGSQKKVKLSCRGFIRIKLLATTNSRLLKKFERKFSAVEELFVSST